MKKRSKKTIWKILLFCGFIPFIIPIFLGIGSTIFGHAGLCFFGCEKVYGIKAFLESIYLYSYLLWPSYIIGLLLIVFSTIKLKKNWC